MTMILSIRIFPQCIKFYQPGDLIMEHILKEYSTIRKVMSNVNKLFKKNK